MDFRNSVKKIKMKLSRFLLPLVADFLIRRRYSRRRSLILDWLEMESQTIR